MDERLKKALDALDAAEMEMIEGDDWPGRDPEDYFYTVACELAYLWRAMNKPPEEPKPGRFTTGVRFGLSPIDGNPYMERITSDDGGGEPRPPV